MSYSVKKGDFVKIIAGKDKGKTAEIIAVDAENHRLLIDGKDLKTKITKAVKPRKANEKGGLVEKQGTIDISNVQPVCGACGEATRVNFKVLESGEKVRICHECGAVLVTKKPDKKKGKADKAEKTETPNKKVRTRKKTDGEEGGSK